MDGSHVLALAVGGASRPASPSAASAPTLPRLNPKQIAAATAARAAAQDKDRERNGSDGDSDLDFFTPLSSPLRELSTPSMPASAIVQSTAAAQIQQQQRRQQQLQQPKQQLLEQGDFLEMAVISGHGAPVVLSNSIHRRQQHSTSSLPTAKECGLLLGRFPLRRRYMSVDCGGSPLQQDLQHEQQLQSPTPAVTVLASAGMQIPAKSAISAAIAKDRMQLTHRIQRAPVHSRRCQGRPLLNQQQRHHFQWVQQPRQPFLQQQEGQQLGQKHRGVQRDASDDDIRMPLVPPPASSSPLLTSARVAPPTVSSASLQSDRGDAPSAEAANLPCAADAREERTLLGHFPSPILAAVAEGGRRQAHSHSSPLSTVRLLQQPPEEHATEQVPYQAQNQQQQQQQEDSEGLLQCSKRRRFSIERSEATCLLPTGQVVAALPANTCIHATSDNDEDALQRQQSHDHMDCVSRMEELDFSSHRKRKRGGECSTRLLLMLQPNAAAADAALLDVLGTALTAEETRELRRKQQKEAEAAAAAAAAEAEAREITAAAAAEQAAAARARAAAEAEEAAARAKADAEVAQAAAAAAAATSSRVTTEGPKNTLLQAERAPALAAHNALGVSTPLFGTTMPHAPQQQPQNLLQQKQQPPRPQEQQIQQLTQQPQLHQEQQHGQQPHDVAGNNPGLGDPGAVPGRPKLRIRRGNGASGVPSSSTAAGPGVSAAPQQTVGSQQQQQQQPFSILNSSLGQQVSLQQQMDVHGSVFQPSPVQQHQYSQQPQLQQPVQQQQPAADDLGLRLAGFGPTKVPDVTDAGSNPFAFIAGRGRGRGGRRGGMRRR